MKHFILALALLFGFSLPVFAQEKATQTLNKKQEKLLRQLFKDLDAEDFETREASMFTLVQFARHNKVIYKRVEKLNNETKSAEVKARTKFILWQAREQNKLPKIPNPKSTPPKQKSNSWIPKIPKSIPTPKLPTPKMPDLGDLFGGDTDFSEVFKQLGLPPELLKNLQELFKQQFGAEEEKPKISPIKPSQPLFGIAWEPVSPTLRTQLKLSKLETGIVVIDLKKDSFAAKNGIQINDVILKVDLQTVVEASDLDVTREKPTVLLILRQGKRIKIKLPRWRSL